MNYLELLKAILFTLSIYCGVIYLKSIATILIWKKDSYKGRELYYSCICILILHYLS